MLDSEVSEKDLLRVPRLASDCDPVSLELTPAEGFLLSRIDGQTSWKLLREIGAQTPSEVDQCIEEWLMLGVIDIDGRPPRVKRREGAIPETPKPKTAMAPETIDESLIDPSLDMKEEIQREMLEFELRLEENCFDLFGVNTSASAAEIKRAYFKLSKRFHPDRYFRKNLGPYGDRLHRIFKRVSEAYELLSDPASRKEIESSVLREVRTGTQSQPAMPSSQRNSEPKAPLTPIERLRQRMPFRVPEEVRDQKSAKGDDFFCAAQLSTKTGRHAEAAANMRLAVAFDPFNREYKRVLSGMQSEIASENIETMLKAGMQKLSASEISDTKRQADELLLYRPNDADALNLAARVYVALEDAERAHEYCVRTLELESDNAVYHVTMAMVHKIRGNKGHAVAELNQALELNSRNQEAHEMLEALKIKPRRSSANGG